jgi:hypothetical protein
MSILLDRRAVSHYPDKPQKTKKARDPAPPKETRVARKARLARERAAREAFRERLCDDEDAVFTFQEWCALVGISVRQGRRIVDMGQEPVITQISDRRIGVSRRAHRAWQEAKARQKAVPQT